MPRQPDSLGPLIVGPHLGLDEQAVLAEPIVPTPRPLPREASHDAQVPVALDDEVVNQALSEIRVASTLEVEDRLDDRSRGDGVRAGRRDRGNDLTEVVGEVVFGRHGVWERHQRWERTGSALDEATGSWTHR